MQVKRIQEVVDKIAKIKADLKAKPKDTIAKKPAAANKNIRILSRHADTPMMIRPMC